MQYLYKNMIHIDTFASSTIQLQKFELYYVNFEKPFYVIKSYLEPEILW